MTGWASTLHQQVTGFACECQCGTIDSTVLKRGYLSARLLMICLNRAYEGT